MIEINLIPDVKQELIRARMIRSAVISGAIITTLVAVAVVVVLAAYIYGIQKVRDDLVNDAINKGTIKLASVEDLSKILTIQNQLTKINQLNDQKTIDSRIFNTLQAIIPPPPNTIKISSLVIDSTANTISLEGQTPVYPSLESFKKTITAANVRYIDDNKATVDVPLATALSISNISYGEDSTGTKVLRFSFSFTYASELFSPKITNPTIVLIDGGNVTDSYVGIPKSIFTDRAADERTK